MDIAILERLDLQTLERVCRALFDQMGFTAKATGSGAMPGIGEVIVLYGKTSNKPFALLQCAVAGARVDVIQLGQVKNSMAKLSLTTGYLVTVGTIAPGAREFAAAGKINLIDGAKLGELIANLPEAGRKTIVEVLSGRAGKVAEAPRPRPTGASGPPTCAKCGAVMRLEVKMQGPYQTGKYWQCPRENCGYISAYL